MSIFVNSARVRAEYPIITNIFLVEDSKRHDEPSLLVRAIRDDCGNLSSQKKKEKKKKDEPSTHLAPFNTYRATYRMGTN